MRRATVTDLKNRLSYYLRLVKRGETIEICSHSVPVARLLGVEETETNADDRLEQLVRDGVVSRARKKPSRRLVSKPPVPCDADPVRALIEERGDR
ncbi:MAG: type II toxin-antitoxin system Phd/YefM family antitoxin [Planctomycetota bacterium]|jgi:prevent-host-death family protein